MSLMMEDLATEVRRVRGSVTDKQFIRIVKTLSDTGLSVRSISALTNRPKSVIDRAVRAPEKDTSVDTWKQTPLPVLYDVFRETVNSLLAIYVGFQRKAKTEDESLLWAELRRDLIEARNAVSAQDRERMSELVEEWGDETARLKGLRRNLP